ncbi:metal-dependent hydrolase [Fuchsiella alkaliacetigena]|uniref:metal-dependent hydrolase n=1 Tax=Fuchsiella alkaliacetigena TaxID=957042 RepID=UPI00200AACDC|nr:metal-dependent hydrolase [Fuchsiella alkaliacetigena]MCK8823812.1 metal-dependent hydrolase [Fuchsiella alkaliacetigena]
MSYRTHSTFGILFALIIILISNNLNRLLHSDFLFVLNRAEPLTLYLAVLIGALLPDIDHANSKITSKLKPLNWITRLFGIKHRGITHSLIGLALFYMLINKILALGWINQIWYYGLLLGYISHLLADMLNPTGIPLFFPNSRRFSFGVKITTGSWQENIFFSLITLALVIVLMINHGYFTEYLPF